MIFLLWPLITLFHLILAVANTETIEVYGTKFFFKNGTQFFMKGIAYQREPRFSLPGDSYSDPLADPDACLRDVKYLKNLKTNTLRVYSIDVSKNHEECMQIFANAGIYIIADLSEPSNSINRDDPSWSAEIYLRYTKVIDELQGFPNTLGFFAGNEVTTNISNTNASPFVKAAVRDMKAYIKEKGYRRIPVGYSTNDDAITRDNMFKYFLCGPIESIVDFYGLNIYEWCGKDATFETSGYKDRTQEFSNTTTPLFFSEYGCNEIRPRPFKEVQALYSDKMTDVWSGGIVYMYHEEENGYGLVEIKNEMVHTLPDYDYLSSEIAKISPTAINKSLYKPTVTKGNIKCPSIDSNWKASPSLPPVPKPGTCQCLYDSAFCVVSDHVDEEEYGELFNEVCGNLRVDCSDIAANGSTGWYGRYSYCSPKQKLSYLMNKYYLLQRKEPSACDFASQASIVIPRRSGPCDDAQYEPESPIAKPKPRSRKSSTESDEETSKKSHKGKKGDASTFKVQITLIFILSSIIIGVIF